MTMRDLKNKRVLVLGVGLPDGGVGVTNWLLDQRAQVTIVSSPLKRVEEHIRKTAVDGQEYAQIKSRLTWVAGRVTPAMRKSADVVVADTGDEINLFCRSWPRRIVAITGTRGKTTAATWAVHLIGDAVLVGHAPDRSPIMAMSSRAKVAVLECGPRVHLNEPAVRVVDTGQVNADAGVPKDFVSRWGEHNVANLQAACAAAALAGISRATIDTRVRTLPQVPYRQQVIHQDRRLTVVNDATSTSPESSAAAMRRWGAPNCIMITGGDGGGDFREWAKELAFRITANNTIFLAGSATRKMRQALGPAGRGIRAYDSLERCYRQAWTRAGKFISAVIVFSPGAHVGELFTDESDRGQRFASLVRENVD